MAENKKKSSAEATANLLTREQYITIRQAMQEKTHVIRLLDYLWRHGRITSFEAFEKLHNTRISATVSALRYNYGVPVKTTMVEYKMTDGRRGRYGIYSIERRP